MTAGHFDDDGEMDLAIVNSSASGTVTILLGAGGGTFTPAQGSPIAVDRVPRSSTTGHFDDDADLDLAVANRDGNNVSILLGNGEGGFAQATGSPIVVGGQPVSVATGHFDDDVHLDLVVANRLSEDLSILLGNGDGTFEEATGSRATSTTTPNSIWPSAFPTSWCSGSERETAPSSRVLLISTSVVSAAG